MGTDNGRSHGIDRCAEWPKVVSQHQDGIEAIEAIDWVRPGALTRAVGVVDDVRSLHRGDHLCWPFPHRDALTLMASCFVADGVERGEQIVYFGWCGIDEAHRDVCRVEHLASLLEQRVMVVEATDITHGHGANIAPERVVDGIRIAAQAAEAAGFNGLRLFADATELVKTPKDREAFLEMDQGLERLMADGLGVTAICALNTSVLDREAMTDVACVHPATYASLAPFTVHADRGGKFRLAGEVDWWNYERLERSLGRFHPRGSVIEVDVADLEFIDQRSLLSLEQWAKLHASRITLVRCQGVVARLAKLLPLEWVVAQRSG